MDYLLSFDTERLLCGFRENAKLSTNGARRYAGWENTLIAGHTVGHYLSAFAQAYQNPALTAAQRAKLDDILDKLPEGVDTLIGTEGTFLSGGEQQRVALARAILKDAPIVVLDEATAFADPENEALIHKALAALTKDRTVIMIAHRLSTVVGADQIIVLDSGHGVEQGTHEELLKQGGLYARMWSDYQQAAQWKISGEEGR
jgi:ATP-binding cassette subfamily B protein